MLGLPRIGFVMASALTIRAIGLRMPFSLGWWAFTFPVGTMTPGTYGLYAATHAALFLIARGCYLGFLSAMWVLVATRSLRHARATYAVGLSAASGLP